MDRIGALSSRDRMLLAAVVAIHLILMAAPFNVLSPVDPHAVGSAIWHGHVPYHDFTFEYPPLAILAFLLPGLVPHGLALPMLAVQALALEVAVVVLVLRHHAGALRRYGWLSLAVWPFLSGGFDAIPMAAIAVSTAWLVEDRAAGWWAAAGGALVKLSPGAAWVWARRHMAAAVLALAVTVALGLAPLLVASSSTSTYIGYTAKRGVQVESVAGTTKWLGDRLTGHRSLYVYRFRAWEIRGAGWLGTAWTVLALAGLLAVAVHAGRHGPRDPWLAAFVTVLLLLVGFRVFSPQYVVWPAPLAAVLGGRWFRAWLTICAVTLLPYIVASKPYDFLGIALVRNIGVVALAAAGVVALLRSATPTPVP